MNCATANISLLLSRRGGKVITIFLCDDDVEIRKKYSQLIRLIAQKNNHNVSITTFESAEEMLFVLDDIKVLPDIVYLDVQMKQMNGLDAAAKIRELGIHSEIIFLSNLKEYVFDSFDVMPSNYLLKYSVTQEQFELVMMKSIVRIKSLRKQLLVYEVKGLSYTLLLSDVVYIEVKKRIIEIKTFQNQIIEFYSTIDAIERQVKGSSLIRVQRSFIVNMSYIKTYGKSEIILTNGSVVPVGRTYQSAFENEFVNFINQ